MRRTIALLAACGLILAPGALAQGNGRDRGPAPDPWTGGPVAQLQDQGWGNQFSPGEARDARKEGRTVPLSQILKNLKRDYGGYHLNAELYSQDAGSAVYEIDWLTEDGRKLKITVNAQTGAVIDRRGG
ncbi:PepSY domain-containing protein [Hyphomonas sp.]|uniref:PepSY domain-containing protein n=1 Tax=Hyphomonas sp. TaxID=87 RepID=UPI00391BD1D8